MDPQKCRNEWSLGRVASAIKSKDDKVRKAEVVVVKEGQKKTYLRPIQELILLLPVNQAETIRSQE